MTDLPETLARFRLPLKRDHLKQARDLAAPRIDQARAFAAPAARYAKSNPWLLIGAGVVAIAGIVAWTNRAKIAAKAAPMIDDAKVKGAELMDEAKTRSQTLLEEAKSRGQTLLDDANVKGHDLLEAAKAKGGEIAQKVKAARAANTASGEMKITDGFGPSDVH